MGIRAGDRVWYSDAHGGTYRATVVDTDGSNATIEYGGRGIPYERIVCGVSSLVPRVCGTSKFSDIDSDKVSKTFLSAAVEGVVTTDGLSTEYRRRAAEVMSRVRGSAEMSEGIRATRGATAGLREARERQTQDRREMAGGRGVREALRLVSRLEAMSLAGAPHREIVVAARELRVTIEQLSEDL